MSAFTFYWWHWISIWIIIKVNHVNCIQAEYFFFATRVLLYLPHGLQGSLVQQKLRSSTTFQPIANPSKARSKSDALSKLSRYCSEASESAIQVLKVSKSQKHFFLKLHCQKNERKWVFCLHGFLRLWKNNSVSRENGENCLLPQIPRCLG